ncbi:MAG: hypothetical protein M1829_000197 [Trizodia sp. TS-e1964]|nr:MAG: hypothetical protein M1829_000197 [Trizodia sp. TS-e1964]
MKNAKSTQKNGNHIAKSTETIAQITTQVAKSIPRIQLLSSLHYKNDNDRDHFPVNIYHRVLVDGKFIKYLVIDDGVFDMPQLFDPETFATILPSLPPDDWNHAYFSKNPTKGGPYCIEFLDFKLGQMFHCGTYRATSSRLDSEVILKTSRFPSDMQFFEVEPDMYETLEGHQMTPKFLGHLMEHGRVVGIIIEYISNGHPPTVEDLPLCQQVLAKMHKLGFLHGDINKHQFIICDGRAFLIDFATTRRCDDPKLLEEEFQSLEKYLLYDSDFGAPFDISEYPRDSIVVGYLHILPRVHQLSIGQLHFGE